MRDANPATPEAPTAPRKVRAIILPQDAMPRVEEVVDALPAWYAALRCTTIQVTSFRPEMPQVVAVCDDEGRLANKAPNPWTMLLGRPDFMGDVVIVGDQRGEFADVNAQWAERLVARLRAHCEPSMGFIDDPADPRLTPDQRAFLDPTGGIPR